MDNDTTEKQVKGNKRTWGKLSATKGTKGIWRPTPQDTNGRKDRKRPCQIKGGPNTRKQNPRRKRKKIFKRQKALKNLGMSEKSIR